MSINLYDISAKTSIQILNAAIEVLKKAQTSFSEAECNALLGYQLKEDMLPMAFQINSVRHHSLGSIEGMQRGEFNPPPSLPEMDFADYVAMLQEALDQLKSLNEQEVNALADKPMFFRMGKDFEIPFLTQNFAMSFSIPNLMFHATTLYDMLRIKGLEIGKTDFLGQMRTGH